MGLDMYIHKKVYCGAHFEHNNIQTKVIVHKTKDDILSTIEIDNPVSSFEIQVAYWRKANAIHGWFCNNIGNQENISSEVYLPMEKIVELIAVCKEAIKLYEIHDDLTDTDFLKFANDNLPPMSGFFFGSTDIDEWYLQDLQDTVKQLEELILDHEKYKNEYNKVGLYQSYYYNASW